MQFNSYDFIFYFLPIVVFLYYTLGRFKQIIGKIIIIFASIFFYSFGHANMLIYLGISIAFNYCAAILVKKYKFKNKILLALPIVVNVGLLLYFKYLNFAITNINAISGSKIGITDIVLPLGISFYSFQQIAYIVATERGELKDNSFIDYLTYILYFPKLIMGPIIDPVDFINQLNQQERKRLVLQNLVVGIKLFSLGLIKKVLLADTFADAVSWGYSNMDTSTAMDCILVMLFYTFEIYFDFSGYSDMAVGVSSMLNIDLPMNFDSPYKAISIRDFWKRWHISLTKFLTKYIYIPLGGSKKGTIFTYVNTLIVFIVSGLWHGANWTFVQWGLFHGLLSCFDRMFDTVEKKIFMPIRWLLTFIVVNVLWLLFSAPTVGKWHEILARIIYMQSTEVSYGLICQFNIVENDFIYSLLRINDLAYSIRGFNMILFMLISCFICFISENNYKTKDRLSVGSLLLSAFSFVWGVLCLGAESTFVYFGF